MQWVSCPSLITLVSSNVIKWHWSLIIDGNDDQTVHNSTPVMCGVGTRQFTDANPQNFLDPRMYANLLHTNSCGRGLTRIQFRQFLWREFYFLLYLLRDNKKLLIWMLWQQDILLQGCYLLLFCQIVNIE